MTPEPQAVNASARKRGLFFDRVQWGVSSLLVLAIVAMANWLAFRHYERWDWTREGIYTVSDRTEKELAALTQNVDIYVFLSRAEANFADVEELLTRYKGLSPKITVHVVDPDRDPANYKLLAQRFDVGTATDVNSGGTFADVAAVVVSGDKRWSVTRDALVGLDVGSLDNDKGPLVDVKAEQALTGAIVQVISGAATKVCVTQGHGEWAAVESKDGRTLAPIADELRRDNVGFEAIDTFGVAEISTDCSAVFVVGPIKAFSDVERELLRAYVGNGGNLLLALDPVVEHEAIGTTGLEALLGEWGISLDASVVLELDTTRLPPPGNAAGPYFVVDYGKHPMTEALAKLRTPWVARVVRSVRGTRDGAVTIATTSKNSYAETSVTELAQSKQPLRGEGDIDGPVSIAVAAVPGVLPGKQVANPRGGRVFVIGDADWLAPEFMRPDLANRDLLSAATGWLTARETLIAIAPKKIAAQRMTITEGDLSSLFWRLLVFMPGAVMALGLAAWWSRRA
jgi:ABC-2 type transport system permease protein